MQNCFSFTMICNTLKFFLFFEFVSTGLTKLLFFFIYSLTEMCRVLTHLWSMCLWITAHYIIIHRLNKAVTLFDRIQQTFCKSDFVADLSILVTLAKILFQHGYVFVTACSHWGFCIFIIIWCVVILRKIPGNSSVGSTTLINIITTHCFIAMYERLNSFHMMFAESGQIFTAFNLHNNVSFFYTEYIYIAC